MGQRSPAAPGMQQRGEHPTRASFPGGWQPSGPGQRHTYSTVTAMPCCLLPFPSDAKNATAPSAQPGAVLGARGAGAEPGTCGETAAPR